MNDKYNIPKPEKFYWQRKIHLLLIAGASAILAACSGKAGFNDFGAAENTPVAQVFEDGCSKCHGSDGGGMLFGMMFKLDPAGKPATELAMTILTGREKMPSFPKLTEKQRLELANHILELRK
jgi:mono/diheme cytochrome c family protein